MSDPTSIPPATALPRPRRRRPVLRLVLGLLAFLLLVGGATTAQLLAGGRFDTAAENFDTAVSAASTARDSLADTLARERRLVEEAAALGPADSGVLTTASERDGFGHVIEAARKSLDEVSYAVSTPLPTKPDRPIWAWELWLAASDIDGLAAQIDAETQAIGDTRESLSDPRERAQTAAREHLATAVDAATTFEDDYPSARNAEIILLRLARDLSDQVVDASDFSQAGEAFTELQAAASAVIASHEAVMTEKSGPLLTQRLEVEEYARSIAGGVLLDFSWQPIVNGRGTGGTAGGRATWNAGDGYGGYSTITLSNSVAEQWPAAVMQALVTHEVGHAISAKCYEMFEWEDRDANEEWATAWALSMGHTAEGNGVSLYGYPRQAIIDKAATCR